MAEHLKTRLIKNSVLSLFNELLVFSTTWLISIWVARQLGPTNYGVFTLVLWLSGTFSWAAGMGLIHAVTKFVAEHRGRGDDLAAGPIVMFVLKLELVISGIGTVILIFFRSPIADFFFSPSESFYFLLSFFGLVPGIVSAVLSATIQGIQKFEYFTWATLTITPLSLASKVVVLLLGMGIEGLLIVMLVFSFINVGFYLWVLRKEGITVSLRSSVDRALRKRIGSYNASVSAILLCDKIVWDKSENFFLGRLCPAAEIGFYNLGVNVVQRITTVLPQTFWAVLFPAMSHYAGSGDEQKMRRLFFVTTRYLAFFSFPVGIAGLILSYPLIRHLYGPEYLGAQRVFQIMFVCSIFSNLSNPAAAVLYGYDKQSFIYKYGAVLAVLNLSLDFLFIKKYGAVGAAVCYGITTFLGSVGGLIYTCRKMHLRYPMTSVFKILFSTIIMGIAMQTALTKIPGIPGLVFTILTGAGVYLICSSVLGSFESEDCAILSSVKRVLPGKTKNLVDLLIAFITQFKHT